MTKAPCPTPPLPLDLYKPAATKAKGDFNSRVAEEKAKQVPVMGLTYFYRSSQISQPTLSKAKSSGLALGVH